MLSYKILWGFWGFEWVFDGFGVYEYVLNFFWVVLRVLSSLKTLYSKTYNKIKNLNNQIKQIKIVDLSNIVRLLAKRIFHRYHILKTVLLIISHTVATNIVMYATWVVACLFRVRCRCNFARRFRECNGIRLQNQLTLLFVKWLNELLTS